MMLGMKELGGLQRHWLPTPLSLKSIFTAIGTPDVLLMLISIETKETWRKTRHRCSLCRPRFHWTRMHFPKRQYPLSTFPSQLKFNHRPQSGNGGGDPMRRL